MMSSSNAVFKAIKKVLIDQIINVNDEQNLESRMNTFAIETEKHMI